MPMCCYQPLMMLTDKVNREKIKYSKELHCSYNISRYYGYIICSFI